MAHPILLNRASPFLEFAPAASCTSRGRLAGTNEASEMIDVREAVRAGRSVRPGVGIAQIGGPVGDQRAAGDGFSAVSDGDVWRAEAPIRAVVAYAQFRNL